MADYFQPPDTKALVKSIIFGLAIFIFWSFLAIYAVLFQPMDMANPAMQFISGSDNLAISIFAEIIASYLSPFTILNMLVLFSAIGISSTLRAGISRLITSEKKRTTNPLPSLFCGDQSNNIRLADRMKSQGNDVLINIEALVTPVTIEIPARMAVILEMNDKKLQVITGRKNDASYIYRVDNGSAIIGLFPLEKQKTRMIFETDTRFGKNYSEEWIFQYGFPMKKSKGYDSVDPNSILAAVGGGDYMIWKRLVRLCILSALTSIGFCIKHGDINNPNYLHLKKQMHSQEQGFPNRENKLKTIQSHKRVYLNPFRKGSTFRPSFIRRKRNFTRSLPDTHLNRLSLNKQKNSDKNLIIFDDSLQQKFCQNFLTNLRRIYNFPVAEVEITSPINKGIDHGLCTDS